MKKNQRVKLKSDYTNEWGILYRIGQEGFVLLDYILGNQMVIEFDGYEKDRQMAQEMKEKNGEGPNIVRFVSLIPVELLEVTE